VTLISALKEFQTGQRFCGLDRRIEFGLVAPGLRDEIQVGSS